MPVWSFPLYLIDGALNAYNKLVQTLAHADLKFKLLQVIIPNFAAFSSMLVTFKYQQFRSSHSIFKQ